MDYEFPIGSGFTICVPADQLDAWCQSLRSTGLVKQRIKAPFHITNANGNDYRGVYWRQVTHSWRATITIDGRLKHLGYFKDKSMAILARQRAEAERDITYGRDGG